VRADKLAEQAPLFRMQYGASYNRINDHLVIG
jgi:hypothetical protein